MKKLALGIATIGLLAGSVFAADSYYIFSGSNVAAWGTANYVYGYTYGTATVDNPVNLHDPAGGKDYVNEGVGKIVNASVPASSGVYIAVDNKTGNTKSITDCVGGFSYWYIGGAHDINLEYPESNCTGTGDKWNNKWRATATATTSWTKKTIALSGFTQVPGGACNVSAVNLSIAKTLAWGTQTEATGYNLAIGNVACIGDAPLASDVAPTAGTTWAASAEDLCTGYYCNWTSATGGATDCGIIETDKSGAGGTITATCTAAIANCASNSPSKKVYSNNTCTTAITFSSSSAAGGASSSSGGSSSSVGGGSSSSDEEDTPIISHNKAPVVGLSLISFARNLQIASDKDATVALFNMQGKRVFSQKVLSGTTTLSLQKQRQGVYYAVVRSGSQKQTVKVVLK